MAENSSESLMICEIRENIKLSNISRSVKAVNIRNNYVISPTWEAITIIGLKVYLIYCI